MSTQPIAIRSHTLPRPDASVFGRLSSFGTWLFACMLAGFFSLIMRDATVIGGVHVPLTDDSLYHAHRILDAARGTPGFYEFDPRLHVPNGSWISWPWGYDYLMAKAAQFALWLDPSIDPTVFISYVPSFWILVNAAIFLAAASALGLSREMRLIAMLCFALSPLTQMLHSFGMIDHHYVEHTFVLLTIWLGLRWFSAPDRRGPAIWLGVALGAAPAFHNGLFILQLLPLSCLFVLWLRSSLPSRPALLAFATALVVATQVVLLPSLPYRRLMFEFDLLSWFHFYVAVCTAAVVAYFAYRPVSRGNSIGLGALCVALALPLVPQVVTGMRFLAGNFSILSQIAEIHSPYDMFTNSMGPVVTASYYSWLLLLAPVLLAFYAYQTLREREPKKLYYVIAVVGGLAMLLDQFRLHYYGFFALVTGALLIVDELRRRYAWHRGAVFVLALAAVFVAYQPPLRQRLFVVYAPGADDEYAAGFPILMDLHRLCAEDPGVVLANSDDGNAILFHSDCSVIANNFILRPDDGEHIALARRLLSSSPEEIRNERRDVKYLFLRSRDFSMRDGKKTALADSYPVARELLTDREPPPGFTLIKTIRMSSDDASEVYARLYKVAAR
jgi:hypothetical protein